MRTAIVSLNPGLISSDAWLWLHGSARGASDGPDHLFYFEDAEVSDPDTFTVGHEVISNDGRVVPMPQAVGSADHLFGFALHADELARLAPTDAAQALRHARRFVIMAGPMDQLRARAYHLARWLAGLYPHADYFVSIAPCMGRIGERGLEASEISPVSVLDIETAPITISTHAETAFATRFMRTPQFKEHLGASPRSIRRVLLYTHIQALLAIERAGSAAWREIDALFSWGPWAMTRTTTPGRLQSPRETIVAENRSRGMQGFEDAARYLATPIENFYGLNDNCRRFLASLGPDFRDPGYADTRERWISNGFLASRAEIDDYFDRVLARLPV